LKPVDKLEQHQCARFSSAAVYYEKGAHIQHAVAERLLQGITFCGKPARILDIGCGTGLLTRRLAEMWPDAYVLGIDHAPGMIEEALRLNAGADRPCYALVDALRFQPEEPFDLIASSSTLHWIQPLEDTMRTLARFMAPEGNFAFALMLEGTLGELHEAREMIAPDRPPRLRMPVETCVKQALEAANLRVINSDIEARRAYAPNARELVRNLQRIGVTGGPLSRGDRPLSRTHLNALLKYYDAHFCEARGVYASFRIGYFWGRRHA
jgi:malonyl-CoA O-methyltransferase